MNTQNTYKALRTLAHLGLVFALVCTGAFAYTASGCDIASPCRSAFAKADAKCTCGGGEGGCCGASDDTAASSCCSTEVAKPVEPAPSTGGCCSTKQDKQTSETGCAAASKSNCHCSMSVPDSPIGPAREVNPVPVGKRADELQVLALAELMPVFALEAESGAACPDTLPPPESPRLDILCRYLC